MVLQFRDGLGDIAADAIGDIARRVELAREEIFAGEEERRTVLDENRAQGLIFGFGKCVCLLHGVEAVDGTRFEFFERQIEFLGGGHAGGFERLTPLFSPERVDLA
ncbi:MAG: hypothetical protein ACK55I_38880, partial [bacterium]